jgi:hypothetical protein
MRDRAIEREKLKIRQEMETMQQFRVDNKHSIFLNTRNRLRPIHERTSDIILDKELSVERMRNEINVEREKQKKLEDEQEELENEGVGEFSRAPRRPVTKGELEEIINRLSQR